jgi:hypothetical protein
MSGASCLPTLLLYHQGSDLQGEELWHVTDLDGTERDKWVEALATRRRSLDSSKTDTRHASPEIRRRDSEKKKKPELKKEGSEEKMSSPASKRSLAVDGKGQEDKSLASKRTSSVEPSLEADRTKAKRPA